jgi:Tol biopolymer transport system component
LTNEPGILQILSGSADGEWVVYQSMATGNIDLKALRVAGGDPHTVVATPEHDYPPFLSPSGRWLHFQINHENFYRVPGPAQGFKPAQPERVTSFAETGLLLDDPQWSADGRYLLHSHGRRPSDIWLATLR